MFCVDINRDSRSLFRFPLYCQVFSSAILSICCLKSPYIFFFPLLFPCFYFGVYIYVVNVVITGYGDECFFFFFFAVFNVTPESFLLIRLCSPKCWLVHFLLFFDKNSLFISSLGYKVLCIVINFLVLGTIYLSYSPVLFRNDPEYLTRDTAQVFINPDRSGIYSFNEIPGADLGFKVFSRLSNSFLLITVYLMVSVSNTPSICTFPSLQAFWFFHGVTLLFLLLVRLGPLFSISMAHFSMPNSIPISWLHILIDCIKVSSSFSFLQIALCRWCT